MDSARGLLYVSDVNQGVVYSLDLKSKKSTVLAKIGVPQALALANDGSTLLLADSGRKQVEAIVTGSAKAAVKPVTAAGTFEMPCGLAWWDATHIIVADGETGALSLVEIASGRIMFSIAVQ